MTKSAELKESCSKDLTDFLGLEQTAYTDWKSGKSASYERYLPQIADFLDVQVDYLPGRTQMKKPPPPKGQG